MNETANLAPGKERLLKAARAAMARHGYNAMSVNDLLKAAEVPKGVMYHHFPGGKSELACHAIRALGLQSAQNIAALAAAPSAFSSNLSTWFGHAGGRLKASRFELGCPLATTALEVGADDLKLRGALNEAFETMRTAIAQALVARAMSSAKARDWSFLIIAAFEGALLQARVSESLDSLENSIRPLLALLNTDLNENAP